MDLSSITENYVIVDFKPEDLQAYHEMIMMDVKLYPEYYIYPEWMYVSWREYINTKNNKPD